MAFTHLHVHTEYSLLEEDTEPVECEPLPEENEMEADTKNYAEIL